MKQLTKEQHEAILNWLKMVNKLSPFDLAAFNEEFPPACCDSCAEGHTCDSDIVRGDNESAEDYMERLKQSKSK